MGVQNKEIREVVDGGVCSARDFKAGGIFSGIKNPGKHKRDIGLVGSDRPCVAAGTFTQNSILSPSVVASREFVDSVDDIYGIIASSGSANCAVGKQGLTDAYEMAKIGAERLGAGPKQVLVATTGIIGVEMPMKLIREFVPRLELSANGGWDFSRSIMTTDTYEKQYAVQFEIDGKTVTIGGCAKGSGMIHPNMATMLAFITTDAAVARPFLKPALREIVAQTFNQIDVDGDQSTNDMVLVLANGAAENRELDGNDAESELFRAALYKVCEYFAKAIVRDAEGGKGKVIEVLVTGAVSTEEARKAARSVASSLLVKTAVYGRDPNWGRIMMAVGKTQVEVKEELIRVFVNGIQIVEGGHSIPFNSQSVVGTFGSEQVIIEINIGSGACQAKAWGGEMTEEYVVFNSAYTT